MLLLFVRVPLSFNSFLLTESKAANTDADIMNQAVAACDVLDCTEPENVSLGIDSGFSARQNTVGKTILGTTGPGSIQCGKWNSLQRPNFHELRPYQLRDQCKKLGLAQTGTKEELIARLEKEHTSTDFEHKMALAQRRASESSDDGCPVAQTATSLNRVGHTKPRQSERPATLGKQSLPSPAGIIAVDQGKH